MAFIDNMRNKLSHAGQSTVQKAKDLSELARLNSIISSSENQISEIYAKIGYEIYCAYYNNPLPEVAELIAQITDLHQTINSCKSQISAISPTEACPRCGVRIGKEMAFCSKCGYQLTNFEQTAPNTQSTFCNHCGAVIAAGSAFCNSCGQKIG